MGWTKCPGRPKSLKRYCNTNRRSNRSLADHSFSHLLILANTRRAAPNALDHVLDGFLSLDGLEAGPLRDGLHVEISTWGCVHNYRRAD